MKNHENNNLVNQIPFTLLNKTVLLKEKTELLKVAQRNNSREDRWDYHIKEQSQENSSPSKIFTENIGFLSYPSQSKTIDIEPNLKPEDFKNCSLKPVDTEPDLKQIDIIISQPIHNLPRSLSIPYIETDFECYGYVRIGSFHTMIDREVEINCLSFILMNGLDSSKGA